MALNHVQQVRILYKTLLKLHKGLPAELQVVGDNYVKDEFKRHKKCKPEEADVFMKEWSSYAFTIAKQLMFKRKQNTKEFGKNLSENLINDLRDDQIQQLYDLMVSAKETPTLPVNEK